MRAWWYGLINQTHIADILAHWKGLVNAVRGFDATAEADLNKLDVPILARSSRSQEAIYWRGGCGCRPFSISAVSHSSLLKISRMVCSRCSRSSTRPTSGLINPVSSSASSSACRRTLFSDYNPPRPSLNFPVM